MTLLVYTASARDDDGQGLACSDLFRRIEERYPLAFSMLATRDSNQTPQVSDRHDWVTLPATTGTWEGSDRAAARMLMAYARQYRPAATVFLGSDAPLLRQSCHELDPAFGVFGEELLITSPSPDADNALFERLDRILPASILLSEATSLPQVADVLDLHPPRAGLLLYWEGVPSHRVFEALRLACEKTTGDVKIQFGLKEVVLNFKRSLPSLLRLAGIADRRVQISIVGEDSVALVLGRGLTNLLRQMRRLRSSES